ncbi:MAG: hypothetical protein CMH48_09970 [Muricauda sp.]|nr:hypothetical protein [Allomuricauda sp.]MAU27265.1 hypothetical protein [Allomuricauda sp.]MBC31160.1 hypothetical protein [Allomuricauda sp.]
MKKNKKTYVLLALVVIIWGVLGFRLVKTLNPQKDEITIAENLEPYTPIPIKKRDTFSVSANYRDPFLGTLPKNSQKEKRSAIQIPKTPERMISYQGSVSANGSQSRLFFISIDGQQHVFEKGKVIDGVALVWGNDQRIKVRYGTRTETHTLE